MRIFVENVSINKPLRMTVQGRYFRLIDAGAGVTVAYHKAGRDIGETALGVGPGYWFEMPEGEKFEEVVIYSSVAQQVRFGITQGRGGIDAYGYGSGQGGGNTAGGQVSESTLLAVRSTVQLIEPGLTIDELDAAMGFYEAWPVGSTSQGVYLLTNAVRDASVAMSGIVNYGLPVQFAHLYRTWDASLTAEYITALDRIFDPFEAALIDAYPQQVTNTASTLHALVNNQLQYLL